MRQRRRGQLLHWVWVVLLTLVTLVGESGHLCHTHTHTPDIGFSGAVSLLLQTHGSPGSEQQREQHRANKWTRILLKLCTFNAEY